MEASTYKSDGMLAKEIEDELMKYTKKCDHKVEEDLVMKTDEVQRNSDEDVNITECTKSSGNEHFAAEFQDTTENSSSFEDCNSGVDDVDALGDSEASSDFHGDAASALDFDGFGERFRMRYSSSSSTFVVQVLVFGHPPLKKPFYVTMKSSTY